MILFTCSKTLKHTDITAIVLQCLHLFVGDVEMGVFSTWRKIMSSKCTVVCTWHIVGRIAQAKQWYLLNHTELKHTTCTMTSPCDVVSPRRMTAPRDVTTQRGMTTQRGITTPRGITTLSGVGTTCGVITICLAWSIRIRYMFKQLLPQQRASTVCGLYKM